MNAAHKLYYREQETAVAWAEATATRQAELTEAARRTAGDSGVGEPQVAAAARATAAFTGNAAPKTEGGSAGGGTTLGSYLHRRRAASTVTEN